MPRFMRTKWNETLKSIQTPAQVCSSATNHTDSHECSIVLVSDNQINDLPTTKLPSLLHSGVLPTMVGQFATVCQQHCDTVHTQTYRHTHTCLMAPCPGLPGWASTRSNTHLLTLTRKKKKDLHRQQGLLWASEGCYTQWHPIKPAYNQSWLDGQLILTASAFDLLWIRMLAILVTVPTVTQNLLHSLSTSSVSAHHLVDFVVQGKITEADAQTIPFLQQMPFLPQPSQFILA